MTYAVRDGSGDLIQIKSTVVGGVHHNHSILTTPDGSSVSQGNGLPVMFVGDTSIKVRSNLTQVTDYSGVLQTDESIQVLPTNFDRSGITFQNLSTNNLMFINFGAAATPGSGSIALPPLGLYEMPASMITQEPIYIKGVTGDQYTLKEATSQIIYSPSILKFSESYKYIAEDGQTSIPLESSEGTVLMVWVNGIKLSTPVDFDYNTTAVTFVNPLAELDEVEVVLFTRD